MNFETEVRNPFKPAENSAIDFNCTNKKKHIIITYYLFTFITPFPPVYSQTIKSGTNANAERQRYHLQPDQHREMVTRPTAALGFEN